MSRNSGSLKHHFTDLSELARVVKDCSQLARDVAFFPGGDLAGFEADIGLEGENE
jgi:hypothetical protein